MYAMVRDLSKERGFSPGRAFSPTTSRILDDPAIPVVAEAMGGVEPAGEYVLELLRSGRPVVTANKQLVARRGPELFEAAAREGCSFGSRRPCARRSR